MDLALGQRIGWKSFEGHAEYMDIKGNSGEYSQRGELERKHPSS